MKPSIFILSCPSLHLVTKTSLNYCRSRKPNSKPLGRGAIATSCSTNPMARQTLALAFHLLVLVSLASSARTVGHDDAVECAVVSPPAPEGDVEGREAFELLDTLHTASSGASNAHDAVPPVVDPVTRFHQHVEAAKDQVVQGVTSVMPQPVKDAVNTVHAVGETAENVKDAVSDVKSDLKGMAYNAVDNILFSAAIGRDKEASSTAALLVAAAMIGALFL